MNKYTVAERFGIKVNELIKLNRDGITMIRIFNMMERFSTVPQQRDFWFNSRSTGHIGDKRKVTLWESYIMPVRNKALENYYDLIASNGDSYKSIINVPFVLVNQGTHYNELSEIGGS